mmetsp:Transcript_412/g.1699  ORF Transcript_412/g.1699 Transcript_412/m.1699 type:complete len:85 (+) Transcript_412:158-412(+)
MRYLDHMRAEMCARDAFVPRATGIYVSLGGAGRNPPHRGDTFSCNVSPVGNEPWSSPSDGTESTLGSGGVNAFPNAAGSRLMNE